VDRGKNTALVLINIMMMVAAIAVLMLTVSDGGRAGTARVSDCHRMDETQRLGEPCRAVVLAEASD
jgi:hypothetical protein